MAKRETVISPYSKFRMAVLRKLQELGYVQEVSVEGETVKTIRIVLRYDAGVPALTDVRIWSSSGRRTYRPYREMSSVKGGMGHAIISSSRGIITDREARKEKIGGELLFYIW